MGVLLAHPGTQHAFALAAQLERLGLLDQFWTSLALKKHGSFHRVLSALPSLSLAAAAENRILDGVPGRKVNLRPSAQIACAIRQRMGTEPEFAVMERNRSFQEAIPSGAIDAASAVIGFDIASWILAERATKSGKPFVLDRSAPHVRAFEKVAKKLAAEYPDYASWTSRRPAELHDFEAIEHALAARIVVASGFSRSTMIEQGIPAEKIVVNPYGVDLEFFRPDLRAGDKGPLRFLFVGAVRLGKGVRLLVETWAKANAGPLTIAGPVDSWMRGQIDGVPGVSVVGKVVRNALPDLFRQHDVFVFPSYFDGFGLVVLEAMACGLPVITTAATAGPDLIENGAQGFVIPPGDRAALSECVRFFSDDPGKAKEMGRAARRRAELFTWDKYGDRWKTILEGIGAVPRCS